VCLNKTIKIEGLIILKGNDGEKKFYIVVFCTRYDDFLVYVVVH
jgi:hypothetical protein